MARDWYDIGWIFIVQLPLFALMMFLLPPLEDADNNGKNELPFGYLALFFGVIILTNILWFRWVKPKIVRH